MSERFFVETPISGSQIALTGDEARHLAAVMRAAVGDKLTVFDGLGQEYLCRIVRIAKATIDCEVLEARQPQREAAVRLTLAVALPKGDRQKYLVEKLTELGVARLLPLLTERGVAEPVDNALIRLRRGVIEASKQCRRNQLMEILAPQQSKAFFAQTPTLALRILAHPGGDGLRATTASIAGIDGSPSEIFCAIGPEGGFTTEEVAFAEAAGWRMVSLGPRILRVETAAVACAAMLLLE